MKQLEFLERDYQCPSSDESIESAKRNLKRCGIPLEDIEKMIIHYQYHYKEKQDLLSLLFSESSIKVAYSMYVSGSDSDFMHFMAMAGRNNVSNVTYIDLSGELVGFLNMYLRKEDNAIQILSGINQNNILTFSYEPEFEFKRIEIHFDGYYKDCVKLKEFDMNLLK